MGLIIIIIIAIIASSKIIDYYDHRRQTKKFLEFFLWLRKQTIAEQERLINKANTGKLKIKLKEDRAELCLSKNSKKIIISLIEQDDSLNYASFKVTNINKRRLTTYTLNTKTKKINKTWKVKGRISDWLNERLTISRTNYSLNNLYPP